MATLFILLCISILFPVFKIQPTAFTKAILIECVITPLLFFMIYST